MKQLLYISLFLFSLLSFGQEINIETKTIKGFIFEDPCIPAKAEVCIKGANIKTLTDEDGKFIIQAKVGDILVVSSIGLRTFEIEVTENNCYKAEFYKDTGLYYYPKKLKRERKKKTRKAIRKYKKGFYNCND